MTDKGIYGEFTEEEQQRLVKMGVPNFIPTGKTVEITEEERKQARESIMRYIKLHERAKREKRNIPLTDEELYKED